jgi:hypothetical protein
MAQGALASDIEALRRRAREHIARGAVAPGCRAGPGMVAKH